MIDKVQERGGWANGIYEDLQEAFNKVLHNRFMLDEMNWRTERRTLEVDEGLFEGPHGEVIRGVPQGSLLALVMSAININDMVEEVKSYVSEFADDVKLLRRTRNYNYTLGNKSIKKISVEKYLGVTFD